MKLWSGVIAAFSMFILCGSFAIAGGFEGPGARATITRAVDVSGAPDETPCILEGRLLEKIRNRKDRYLFQDASGQVIVEIKRRVFGDLTVTPADLVRISGEVEQDGRYPNQVEVEYLGLLASPSQPRQQQQQARQPQ